MVPNSAWHCVISGFEITWFHKRRMRFDSWGWWHWYPTSQQENRNDIPPRGVLGQKWGDLWWKKGNMNSIFQRYVLSTSKIGLAIGVTQYNTRYARLFDIQILIWANLVILELQRLEKRMEENMSLALNKRSACFQKDIIYV